MAQPRVGGLSDRVDCLMNGGVANRNAKSAASSNTGMTQQGGRDKVQPQVHRDLVCQSKKVQAAAGAPGVLDDLSGVTSA
eukprot:1141087-Pelagomonas_calceolata.AAC.14